MTCRRRRRAKTSCGTSEVAMTNEDHILFDVAEGVATVTLNRPERMNSVHREMARRLVDLFHEIGARDDVRAVVLTGAGRAFCAGADLSLVESESAVAIGGKAPTHTSRRLDRKSPMGSFAEFTRAIVGVDKPVIAALAGPVVGAGLSYALATDRRIADTTVRMSAIFVRRGLAPDSGISYFLPRIVGLPMALHMVTTGAMLKADEAQRAGLIDELVDEGRAPAAARAYARQIARGASVAVDLARRGIYRALSSTLDEVLGFEEFSASAAAGTRDAAEGIQAFIAKREPDFRGE
jgi:2-(1,2-epoxy-1,2-dihydrophenyl)acetyl-CoA isomerase